MIDSVATSLCKIDNLTVRYGQVLALDNISLAVEAAEHVAIIGPSGSGKTSLLRSVAGFVHPHQGTIRFADQIWNDAARGILVPPQRRRIGMIAQHPALWPHLSAIDHLQIVLKWRGIPHKQRRAEACRLLKLVSLAHRRGHKPAMLSGGEAQRLALARALCGESQLILLDEPLAQLDVVLRRSLGAELRRILKESGRPVLHVTHEPADAAALADRIVILESGRVTHQGTADELRRVDSCPFAREAFTVRD